MSLEEGLQHLLRLRLSMPLSFGPSLQSLPSANWLRAPTDASRGKHKELWRFPRRGKGSVLGRHPCDIGLGRQEAGGRLGLLRKPPGTQYTENWAPSGLAANGKPRRQVQLIRLDVVRAEGVSPRPLVHFAKGEAQGRRQRIAKRCKSPTAELETLMHFIVFYYISLGENWAKLDPPRPGQLAASFRSSPWLVFANFVKSSELTNE